ncbi:hypothetical protein WAK64_15285 [Bacillus spongiae]|uniref:Uncharacterized protein n=1 Tax=Bacillus spongiae TaxID=2683610 RepID=A0ABU8HGZ4_9BACI
MDKTNNEHELRDYLEENIDAPDLVYYNIEVFKKSIQELEIERTLKQLERIVYDYIIENNYTGVEVHYPSIKPEPMIKITIPENSELSTEGLKYELVNLLASKNPVLSVKDIPYEIQVSNS